MNVFVARQPIFDRHNAVVAYELLFRGGQSLAYHEPDGDAATLNVVVNSLLLFGLDKLAGGKRAYINFTENLLLLDIAHQLPKDLIVVEILENVLPSAELQAKCEILKRAGYMLVLDDFVYDSSYAGIFPLVDVIKVDFLQTTGAERREIIARVNYPHIKFLAEKVETKEDFNEALDAGYDYFQGYYFQKPEVLYSRDVPSNKNNYLHIINEINRQDLDFAKLETIINHDVGFSYKLLKYINSAAFGFSSSIHSVRQALVMLGQRELTRWVTVLLLREYGLDKPPELVKLSVIRAKFGESLAKMAKRGNLGSDAFFLGMFSLIDALTDRTLAEVIDELPISGEVKNVLLGRETESPLADIYSMLLAYERGDWLELPRAVNRLKLDEEKIPAAYLHALEWADQLL